MQEWMQHVINYASIRRSNSIWNTFRCFGMDYFLTFRRGMPQSYSRLPFDLQYYRLVICKIIRTFTKLSRLPQLYSLPFYVSLLNCHAQLEQKRCARCSVSVTIIRILLAGTLQQTEKYCRKDYNSSVNIWNHRVSVQFSDWGEFFLRDRREEVTSSLHLRMETDPVSETLCFLVFRVPDDGQSPHTQWFWVLYTIIRTLQNLQVFFTSSSCILYIQDQWLRLAVSKGPNTVGVSLSSP
jgi:hypothetical protein